MDDLDEWCFQQANVPCQCIDLYDLQGLHKPTPHLQPEPGMQQLNGAAWFSPAVQPLSTGKPHGFCPASVHQCKAAYGQGDGQQMTTIAACQAGTAGSLHVVSQLQAATAAPATAASSVTGPITPATFKQQQHLLGQQQQRQQHPPQWHQRQHYSVAAQQLQRQQRQQRQLQGAPFQQLKGTHQHQEPAAAAVHSALQLDPCGSPGDDEDDTTDSDSMHEPTMPHGNNGFNDNDPILDDFLFDNDEQPVPTAQSGRIYQPNAAATKALATAAATANHMGLGTAADDTVGSFARCGSDDSNEANGADGFDLGVRGAINDAADVVEDVALVSADFTLTRDQVIERIEQLVASLVTAAAAGQLPEITCISTAASNRHMAHRTAAAATPAAAAAAGSEAWDVDSEVLPDNHTDEAADNPANSELVLRLGSRAQKKTLLGNGGAQAHQIVRVLQLLDVVHRLLTEGRTATQRDIYYTLLGPPFFTKQRDLTSTIQTTLAMLRVPRTALGISAASKGAVAGRLLLMARPGEAWQDCSLTGPAGRAIPGEVGAIEAMSMRPQGARCVLVVEKDAIFQRLVEDRLFDDLPCIIITGRGMPDIATRAFVAAVTRSAAAGPSGVAAGSNHLASNNNGLPVLGFVDWNPPGVAILLAYKYGTAAMGLEAARYAVPSLSWLGVTSDMLTDVPRSTCQELTQRDKALIPNLKSRLADNPKWVSELGEMEGLGLKADIEALYSVLGHAGLTSELTQRVLRQRYFA